jgi:hypothetical protein
MVVIEAKYFTDILMGHFMLEYFYDNLQWLGFNEMCRNGDRGHAGIKTVPSLFALADIEGQARKPDIVLKA